MRLFILDPSLCQASLNEPGYSFEGAAGQRVCWPTAHGANLGAVGAWNFLRRIGARPQFLSEQRPPQEGDVLVISAHGPMSPLGERIFADWKQRGGSVLATGDPRAFPDSLAGDGMPRKVPSPFSGLAWLLDGQAPQIAAPGGWAWTQFESDDLAVHGQLALVRGERQTPANAFVEVLPGAPAIVRRERFSYLNANPFAALQAWLQGQADIAPWLQWRPRLFWLDEYCAALWRLLADSGALPQDLPRPGAAGIGPLTVVLRHDLDGSVDTGYLEALEARNLPGVHAILANENTGFWTAKLRNFGRQEAALHYSSVQPWSLADALRSKLGKHQKDPFRPYLRGLSPKGLARQVQEAKAKGIGVSTLHRHGPFVLYPEYVEALDNLALREPEVIGASSYFRGIVLRFGTTYPIDGFASMASTPDCQFPFWLPFGLAHAGRGGRLVAAYESSCLIEPEPGLVDQMLRHQIPELPARVLMLNFHPAHARNATFTEGGSLKWYTDTLDLLQAAGAQFMSYAELLRRMHSLED